MSQDEKPQAFREESETWKEAYRDPQLIARRTRKHHEKMLRLGMRSWPRDARIVDIACGTGEVLRILHAEGFTNLVGLDVTIDPGLAREPWLETKVGDGRSLPFPDRSFDIAVCTHSLHHLGGLDGIRSALQGAARILKVGGRLALIDHFDSVQLRFALWCCRQSWLTWPTSGLRSFKKQLDEEWSYLTEYMDGWPKVRALIDGLGFQPVEVDGKGLFFFYWTGRKPL
ncbi:MAG: methyltransferase domain-containing protein [Planctomycetota bacterium]|nr:methyltransferase domain-containing protein [Planctomycetota bacterium]